MRRVNTNTHSKKDLKMAATFAPDLVIDNELVRLGIVETIEQNVEGFNQASNGTIILTSRMLENDFTD
jgi:hypothetical protein